MESESAKEKSVLSEKIGNHLKRCSAFVNLIIEAYPNILFCVAHKNGYFKELYGSWEKTLGWKENDLLASPWLDFIEPQDVEKTKTKAEEMKARNIIRFHNHYRCKDGTYRRMEWTCLAWNGDGTSYCMVKVD